jgi:hypothetical protein
LKANDQYNQNFASNEYQNAYNRYQNNRTTKYNFLSNAAGGGQIAANESRQVGAQYANNIGQRFADKATATRRMRELQVISVRLMRGTGRLVE